MPPYDKPLSMVSSPEDGEEPMGSGRVERAQALLDAIASGDAATVADALDACTGMGPPEEE